MSVAPKLKDLLIHLIEQEHGDVFYMGYQGNFDRMVYRELEQLKSRYTHIRVTVVLAYMPMSKEKVDFPMGADTIFPEELASVPKRFAISRRNRWMLQRADTVICYLSDNPYGGAATFVKQAQKAQKVIFEII